MSQDINVDFSLLKPVDPIGDYVNAFAVGQAMHQNAMRQAALAKYSSDPAAAAAGLIGAGDITGGLQLQNNNQAQSDRAANAAGGAALAAGNTQGAMNAVAPLGIDDVAKVREFAAQASAQQLAAAKQQNEALGSILLGLKGLPPEQRLSAAQHVAQRSGLIDPNNITADDVSDAGIATHIASAQTVDQILDRADKEAAQNETARHNRATEGEPKFTAVGPDQTLVQTAGGAAPQGSSPAGAAPASPLAGPVGDQMRSAAQGMSATPTEGSYLNQLAARESAGNPGATNGRSTGLFQFHPDTFAAAGGGNINDVGDQTKAALTLARQNSPALQALLHRPPTPGELYLAHQQGIGGARALLQAGDSMTAVQALTPVYAAKYGPRAAAIAQQAVVNNGGSPDMTAAQFAQHVQGYFGGGAGGSPPATGAASASGVPAAGGVGSVLFRGANVAQGGAPDAAAAKGLNGPAYLGTLPATQQAIVKALAEGRMPLPSGFAISKPYWQQTLQQLAQYDPSFDTANPGNNIRAKTRAAFTSGKEAANITSINTVVNHLGSLYDSIDEMKNSDFQPINAFSHAVLPQFGNTSYKDFEAAKGAVASELVRTLRGSAGNESDVQYWQKQLDATQTPAQLKKVIAQAVHLISGRLEPLADQYNQGMGTSRQPLQMLRPDGQSVVQRILGGPSVGRRQAPSPQNHGPRVAPTGAGNLTDAQLRAEFGQ